MTQPTIFISYSHADESEKNVLLKHLGVLKNTGGIELWSDDRIAAGANWKQEIEQAMTCSSVALLLISVNFLTSEFILNTEVPTLLKRQRNEGLVVFPIIIKDCAWQTVGWLQQMNVRPKDGKPVWREDGRYVDETLANIVKEIAHILDKARPKTPPPTPDDASKESPKATTKTGPVPRTWLAVLSVILLAIGAFIGLRLFEQAGTTSAPVVEESLTDTPTPPPSSPPTISLSAQVPTQPASSTPTDIPGLSPTNTSAVPVDPENRTIEFSGYTWQVKTSETPTGPGSNYFSGNEADVWVDREGQLHLRIVERNNRWYATEVFTTEPLGYGTYNFTLASRIDHLDKNVVLGLFTWDDTTPEHNHREINIEFGRWGEEAAENGQFVVQPWDRSGNRHRFNVTVPDGYSSHRFAWSPDSIQFFSFLGQESPPEPGDEFGFWLYTGDDIPPEGQVNARINLWLFNGQPPSDGQAVEVVIKAFEFVSQHPPQLEAERLWYRLNNEPEAHFVKKDETIPVTEGDRLCLLQLEYSTVDRPGEHDNAHGEAVLHKPEHPFTGGWHYDDLQSWQTDKVDPGQNQITEINTQFGDGCWTIKKGWDRLVVALVHHGPFGHETDDRLFVWLVQE